MKSSDPRDARWRGWQGVALAILATFGGCDLLNSYWPSAFSWLFTPMMALPRWLMASFRNSIDSEYEYRERLLEALEAQRK